MSDSLLKKEFKQSDVQRARNLINKKFTDKTKIQSGYQKAFTKHSEGDIWEDCWLAGGRISSYLVW